MIIRQLVHIFQPEHVCNAVVKKQIQLLLCVCTKSQHAEGQTVSSAYS